MILTAGASAAAESGNHNRVVQVHQRNLPSDWTAKTRYIDWDIVKPGSVLASVLRSARYRPNPHTLLCDWHNWINTTVRQRDTEDEGNGGTTCKQRKHQQQTSSIRRGTVDWISPPAHLLHALKRCQANSMVTADKTGDGNTLASSGKRYQQSRYQAQTRHPEDGQISGMALRYSHRC